MSYELSGLEDKVAVITGAGRMRSIGRSIALELAKAGCNIVVLRLGTFSTESPTSGRSLAGQRGPL